MGGPQQFHEWLAQRSDEDLMHIRAQVASEFNKRWPGSAIPLHADMSQAEYEQAVATAQFNFERAHGAKVQ